MGMDYRAIIIRMDANIVSLAALTSPEGDVSGFDSQERQSLIFHLFISDITFADHDFNLLFVI